MKRAAITVACLLAAPLCACESDLSNDVFHADEAFLQAVPRRAVLHLSATPESVEAAQGLETAARALGADTAELYRVTRNVTYSVDHQIFGTLRGVEDIVAQPPTERSADRRVWGPFREALSPVEVRFVMDRGGDDHFTYAFEQRPVGGTFAPVVHGDWAPAGAATGDAGQGAFTVELAELGGAGRVEVEFERHAGGVDFDLALVGVADAPGLAATDARYLARRAPDGAGELVVAYPAEASGVWHLKSRWQADGAGRGDAWLETAEGERVEVSECWDTDFVRVYASAPGEAGTVGDAGACVFADQSLPDDDFERSLFGSGGAGVSE
jgi:hypothetical protein